MKKLFILLLAALMLLALTACGAPADTADDGPAGEPAELSTLGDALSADSGFYYSVCDSSYYVYVFENNGVPCRVAAEMTEDLYEALTAIEFTDPDHDAKIMDLIGDLPLIRVDDLSAGIPDQSELDQLVGKTGQELLDEGFQVWGYDEDADEYSLVQGDYQYKACFKEKTENSTGDDDAIRELTLKSLVYDGISTNAADIELYWKAIKTARWIRRTHLFRKDEYICSNCRAVSRKAYGNCPNCSMVIKKTSYDPHWVDEIEDIHAIFDD